MQLNQSTYSNKVTVITATAGNPAVVNAIDSVRKQTHKNVQHLLVVDGLEAWEKVEPLFEKSEFPCDNPLEESVVVLPYSIGKDRWNAHRIYGGFNFVAEGDFVMYLDDDNTIDPEHIEECLGVISAGNTWAYSLRKITDKEGNFLCRDDCESLGKWPSVLHPQDYFVDVNCYFLPKMLGVHIAPLWHRKFREPGQPEVDRVLCQALRQIAPEYDCTYGYTVNYTAGNSENSVQPEFFKKGNADMYIRYNGELPWHKRIISTNAQS